MFLIAKLISTLAISASTFLALSSFASGGESHGDNSPHHQHIFGVFLGQTVLDVDGEDESATSTGLEYEFRFHQHVSVGITYEVTPDAFESHGNEYDLSLYVLSAYYRPDEHLRFGLGLGRETEDNGHDSHSATIVRLGFAYDFHVGGFGIAPTVNVDFTSESAAYVLGVVLSKGF
ncbi:MAG: hypothetical protein COA42_11305 [Alteromonadaceae bacterium]|nr:MAG: hypothetical protein COA42_11305 [Alteromonadaceae bacterium]